jgi:hypothetical protein
MTNPLESAALLALIAALLVAIARMIMRRIDIIDAEGDHWVHVGDRSHWAVYKHEYSNLELSMPLEIATPVEEETDDERRARRWVDAIEAGMGGG